MSHSRTQAAFAGVVALCALVLVGCPERPEHDATSDPTTPATPASVKDETPVARPAVAAETVSATPALARAESAADLGTALPPAVAAPGLVPLPDVFFAFDKASLLPEEGDALASGIAWLLANPEVTVTIEGHCDERGTSEYNLSLGERRANVVRDYLVAAGVPAERIRTVSYGEERPLVPGQDKGTWKFNRRAHFVVVKQ